MGADAAQLWSHTGNVPLVCRSGGAPGDCGGPRGDFLMADRLWFEPDIGTEPVVRVDGLNFAYGEGDAQNQVLFDINLAVMPGQLVVMTGPSGSGKTTLLTLIGALRSLQEGRIDIL